MIRNPDFEPQRNLQYCFYYKGEESNPFHPESHDDHNDAGFAWMSESIACEHCGSLEEFLGFIGAHMGKWDPYDCEERFERYLLANSKIPLDDRIAYVRNRVGSDHPLLAKLEAQR